MSDILEVMAKAICEPHLAGSGATPAIVLPTWAELSEGQRNWHRMAARAVIVALQREGWAVVPMEPTEAMIEAGWPHTADPCWQEDVAKCWRAMIAAARPLKSEK